MGAAEKLEKTKTEENPQKNEKVKAPKVHSEKEKTGSKWTVERVGKFASRFSSVESWKNGHPSSYKAASYWGWVESCSKHMEPSLRLVRSEGGTQAASKSPSRSKKKRTSSKAKKKTAKKSTTSERSKTSSSKKKA